MKSNIFRDIMLGSPFEVNRYFVGIFKVKNKPRNHHEAGRK
jgi:hypothetical protein